MSTALQQVAPLAAHAIEHPPADPHLDRLVRLAASLCQAEVVVIAMAEGPRQWVLSALGQPTGAAPASLALGRECLARGQPHWCEDLAVLPDWARHPLVSGAPFLRFLASVPLTDESGAVVGSFSVAGARPRARDTELLDTLQALAVQATVVLEFNLQHQRLREAEARHEETRLQLALQAQTLQIAGEVARVGGWIYRIEDRLLVWSPEVARIHGLPPGRPMDTAQAFDFYLEADRQVLWQAYRKSLRERQPFDLELRQRTADGRLIWVQVIGQPVCDASGQVTHFQGALKDITERRAAAEESRRDLQARLDIVRIQQEIATATLELDGVMDLLAQRAQALAHADGASVELAEDGLLRCRAASGMVAAYRGMFLSIHDTLSGQVLRNSEPDSSEDTWQDERVNQAISRMLGVRSMVIVPLVADGRALGVLRVVASRPGAFSLGDETHLQILVASLGEVIVRQRLAEQLRHSEAQYRQLFDSNPQPMWVYDLVSLRVLAANQAMVRHYGYTEDELRELTVSALWLSEDEPGMRERLASISRQEQLFHAPRQHRRRDGSVIDVELTAETIRFNGQPARLIIVNDVTERRRTELLLERQSRAQRMLGACNEALVRATSESSLLENVCRITVEIGGYRMAWVGFAQDDAACTVQPVLCFGQGTRYLADHHITWSDQAPGGHGPAGRAIRDGEMVIVADLKTDPRCEPWRDRALAHGFHGVACLPLRNSERSFGLFYLYAPEVLHIGPDEAQLLQALADNLAFGIGNLRAQKEQRRLQNALLKVATAVSASTGTEFFEQLAAHMAGALDAQAAFIVRLPDGDPHTAQAIAGVVHGQRQAPMAYPLAQTPCAELLRTGSCVLRADLGQRYPQTQHVLPGAQAYVGQRMDNGQGEAIGLVFVMFDRPLQGTDFIESTLRIFAARAGAELGRQEADARIRAQASLLDKAQDAIVVRQIDGRLTYWNKGAERLYGWTAAEALDPARAELIDARSLHFNDAAPAADTEDEWTGEIVQHHRDGRALTVESRWTLMNDEHGEPLAVLAINTDISARKAAEQQIQRLAFYDALTGLPNRQLLMDRLQHALASSTRTGQGGALLFIDLDNFKTLNDTLGHDQGDELLRQVAQRLGACVRESDTVARLGGDEFVVLLENLGTQAAEIVQHTRQLGDELLASLGHPYLLAGMAHQSSCSIGVAPFMDGRQPISDLLKQADLAMYQSKTAGRDTLRFFDPAMQAEVSARASLEAAMRQALAQGGFVVYYQPQTERGEHVSGVEALLRWRHPERGMVSPADFIPLAEDTGLIIPLGRWVLDTACEQLALWARSPRTAHLSIAVNVSSRQFRHPDFVEHVVSALQQHGAPPERLKLELTESLLVDDMEATIERMGTLKALGVGFSLDDFGTGYSSLSYLKRLPLDQLKIDQSFMRDVLVDPNDAAIVRTIIALGQSLGLGVIAEGVESADQQQFLARHDCHAVQGYIFGRPMPLDELNGFLDRRLAA